MNRRRLRTSNRDARALLIAEGGDTTTRAVRGPSNHCRRGVLIRNPIDRGKLLTTTHRSGHLPSIHPSFEGPFKFLLAAASLQVGGSRVRHTSSSLFGVLLVQSTIILTTIRSNRLLPFGWPNLGIGASNINFYDDWPLFAILCLGTRSTRLRVARSRFCAFTITRCQDGGSGGGRVSGRNWRLVFNRAQS